MRVRPRLRIQDGMPASNATLFLGRRRHDIWIENGGRVYIWPRDQRNVLDGLV